MLKLCSNCRKHYVEECWLCGKVSQCIECGCKSCERQTGTEVKNDSIIDLAPKQEKLIMKKQAQRKENPNYKPPTFRRKSRPIGWRPDMFDEMLEQNRRGR